MNTSLFSAILCIAIIMLAALVVLVYLLVNPRKRIKTAQKSSTSASQKAPRRNWQIWILFFGIALVFAYWTILGALFFLAVIWLLRLNPGPEASLIVGKDDKKTANRVYTWLFFSPIIAVPFFTGILFNLDYRSSTVNERVLSALIPLLIHVFLLLGLTSKSVFVYRHTQQGMLLIALRAGLASLAAVNVEDNIDTAILLFFLGNGALWLIGSIVGWNQIVNGKCWFMDRKGEKPIISSDGLQSLPAQKHIEKSREFIHSYKADEAKKHALAAFRSGDREIKSQALKLLETLDEVEKF